MTRSKFTSIINVTQKKKTLHTVIQEQAFNAYSKLLLIYRIYCMYSDRQAWTNSVDPDETPQNVAPHQCLNCLLLIQQFLDTTSVSKLHLFKF